MNVVLLDSVPKEPYTNPLFTGPEVTRQPLVPDSRDYNISVITFGKGVRNKLHTHESDQILIVTAGSGIIATEAEQQAVTVGHVAFIPAGERHWHGATEESEFAHITVTRVGSKTTQLED